MVKHLSRGLGASSDLAAELPPSAPQPPPGAPHPSASPPSIWSYPGGHQRDTEGTGHMWGCVPSGQDGEGGSGGHAAVVVLHGHEDVAVVAPVRGPGVLDEPVGLAVQDPIAHGQHRVVQRRRLVSWPGGEKKAETPQSPSLGAGGHSRCSEWPHIPQLGAQRGGKSHPANIFC